MGEFLHQRGLSRMNQLLRAHHDELSGLVLGHLLNCLMYTRQPIFLQAPLLGATLDRLREFLFFAKAYNVPPVTDSSDKLSDKLSDKVFDKSFDKSFDRLPERFSERFSGESLRERRESGQFSPPLRGSLSDDGHSSEDISLSRCNSEMEEVSPQLLQHLSLFLGYGAGIIRHLVVNGECGGGV